MLLPQVNLHVIRIPGSCYITRQRRLILVFHTSFPLPLSLTLPPHSLLCPSPFYDVPKQASSYTSITMSSRRYDSRVSSTPTPCRLLLPQASHANFFHYRRQSSRQKVVSTKSSMPSKPSPSPAQPLAFSQKMASSSPPNAKSQASY